MAAIDETGGALPTGVLRAVAIGNFDGVHLGHARLIGRMLDEARVRGLEATVLTFSPHPARVLAPERAPPLLVPEWRKLALIHELGVERVVRQRFDTTLAALSPREFCETLLVRAVGARLVCVGYDFSFGSARAGTTQTLAELGAQLGFEVMVTPAVRVDGVVCSSSAVRAHLARGEVETAGRLLGRPAELCGEVIHGAARGRTIGFPTANLAVENEAPVHTGVYAGFAELADGSRRRAAINVGRNPTFTAGAAPITVEAHLLEFSGDLYGAPLRVELVRRLRDERRFASIDELVAQIRADVAAAAT